ncbi:MAG: hypothetical protein ACI89U_000172 [Gammaproteobacteria bacterium]|jgi:hypothetical protein
MKPIIIGGNAGFIPVLVQAFTGTSGGRFFFHCLLLFFVFTALLACSSVIDPQTRRQHINALATAQGWQPQIIVGEYFDLVAFLSKNTSPQSQLAIYIEGDGLAWVNKNRTSVDPTPVRALALQLALQHPEDNGVYLARPCQYVTAEHRRHCEPSVWTSGRFSEQVIRATNDAIDVLKAQYQAQSLRLIGYSGGAAVAALVAARREDIVQLITVAGNLDHRAWTSFHNVSDLTNSLNPIDVRPLLAAIPQYHLVGEKDKVVPPTLINKFVSGFKPSKTITVKVVPEFDHQCCWVQHWSSLVPLD